ncbi:helix-turn-helix domain-containing protein [Acetanaerobacterium elongatum]|uniref:Transcriptional regulator, XRE family with cupin sensor n=1 Tax=Acetanaerobacterium elongatum TaxID=258515 RepID=A0A1G9TYP5_9FIRM|nr:XRE family transcriptional regulator [Acetanaerobacterium elongatum]SDM52909.1 transcriptional regulator, XRE family with cupin sensor [Acetanaerobacterium elongatum]
MNSQLEQISSRIKELREILELSAEEVAQKVGIPADTYLEYENAKADIPIGVLYDCAAVLKVDPAELLTGEAPRMTEYTIVRNGKGVAVERYAGYAFHSLALNFIGRKMDPMIVTLTPKDQPPELVSHAGQEFNYVLEGTIVVTTQGHEFVLHEGDSIYFNPKPLHGQRAVGGTARFLTIICD